MTNEPKAGQGLDPEMLAAYIDKRLPPEQRAAVEEQLANDPESYAVLVEALKTMDALPEVRAGAQGPTAPKWAIAGGMLAAAAAIVLVAWMYPELLNRLLGRQSVDPRFDRLVAAVGEDRYIEPRLTGGFKYGPLKSVTRGPDALSQQNLALLAAAGELQRTAQDNPTPDNLHAWAIAQLHLGAHNAAIDTLRTAVQQHPEDAGRKSDLAAALITRGIASNRATDLAESLSLLQEISRLPSPPVEAEFNHALVLEHMGLTDAALQAWDRVIASEPASSGWAREAAQHQSALRDRKQKVSQRQEWRTLLTELESGSADPGVIRDAHQRFPRETREWLEDVLFGAYGRACIVERLPTCAGLRQALGGLAELRASSGDGMALVALRRLESLETMNPAAARRLTEAHLLYGTARTAFEGPDPVSSGPLFTKAGVLFTEHDSPFALWSTNFALSVDYFSGRYDTARSGADRLLLEIASSPYPIVRARTHWLGGLVSLLQGDFERSLSDYEEAIRAYDAAGEPAHATFLINSRGEVKEYTGDIEGAWNDRVAAIRSVDMVDNVRRRHTILIGGSFLAMRQGFPSTALVLADAALLNAAESDNPALPAEGELYRARALLARGDAADAFDSLDRAERLLARAPASVAARLQAEVLWSKSDAAAAAGRADATPVDEAKKFFLGAGVNLRLPVIERVRARVAQQEGDIPAARAAFQRALELSKGQRARLTQQHRLSFVDESWGLLDEVLNFELTHGTPVSDVLRMLDGFVLEEGESGLASGRDAPPDGAVLRFLTLPSFLVVSVASPRGSREIRVRTSRDELAADVSRLLDAARRGGGLKGDADFLEVSSRLFDVLMAPFEAELKDEAAVVIVPDGPLHRLPFGALFNRRAGRFLVEDTALTIVAGRASGAQPAGSRPIGSSTLLIPPAAGDSRPLPAARAEIRSIEILVPSAVVWNGPEDGPLDRLVSKSALIHFAGHARANPLYPASSWLEVSGSGGPDRLYAYDIERWRLLPGAVVILAACETSDGRVSRTEGPLSLAKAFIKAGAGAVVATAWAVDDARSQEMMVDLYEGLASGLELREALKHAQISALKRAGPGRSGPLTWAAYSLYAPYSTGGFRTRSSH